LRQACGLATPAFEGFQQDYAEDKQGELVSGLRFVQKKGCSGGKLFEQAAAT
jgi:hypothetical protein